MWSNGLINLKETEASPPEKRVLMKLICSCKQNKSLSSKLINSKMGIPNSYTNK